MQPIITIFCAFSRRWTLETWLDNLANIEHDPALTNLCFIIDGDGEYVVDMFKKLAKDKGYRSLHTKTNNGYLVNEVKLAIRRARVAELHNQSKELIAKTDGDIIIGLEDDTVFDRLNNFASLYQPLLDNPDVGYVEGVQMGRWGAKIIGAWDADDYEYPQKMWTLLPKEGYQEITAGGFYGYATRRELYLNHEYYTSTDQPYGPDVNYGLYVRNRGYKCLIDWDTIYGHNDYGGIAYPDSGTRLAEVIFTKNTTTGKWLREDNERDRY